LFPSGFASQAYARRALALGGKTFSDFLRGGPRAVRAQVAFGQGIRIIICEPSVVIQNFVDFL
jgi:hypothetical protein